MRSTWPASAASRWIISESFFESQLSSCVALITRVATSGSIGSSNCPAAIRSRKRWRKRAIVSATLPMPAPCVFVVSTIPRTSAPFSARSRRRLHRLTRKRFRAGTVPGTKSTGEDGGRQGCRRGDASAAEALHAAVAEGPLGVAEVDAADRFVRPLVLGGREDQVEVAVAQDRDGEVEDRGAALDHD